MSSSGNFSILRRANLAILLFFGAVAGVVWMGYQHAVDGERQAHLLQQQHLPLLEGLSEVAELIARSERLTTAYLRNTAVSTNEVQQLIDAARHLAAQLPDTARHTVQGALQRAHSSLLQHRDQRIHGASRSQLRQLRQQFITALRDTQAGLSPMTGSATADNLAELLQEIELLFIELDQQLPVDQQDMIDPLSQAMKQLGELRELHLLLPVGADQLGELRAQIVDPLLEQLAQSLAQLRAGLLLYVEELELGSSEAQSNTLQLINQQRTRATLLINQANQAIHQFARNTSEQMLAASSDRVNTMLNLALLSGITLLFAAGLLQVAVKRPILEATRGIRQLTEKGLSHRMPPISGQEFQILADAFNQMADGLQQREQKLILSQEQLSRERAFLQRVIDGIRDPILVVDKSLDVIAANTATLSHAPAEVIKDGHCTGKCHMALYGKSTPCGGDDYPCTFREVFRQRDAVKVIHRHRGDDGLEHTMEVIGTPFWDENDELAGIIETSRDVTDYLDLLNKLRHNESRLKQLANHDTLTGLPNRSLFADRLSQALHKARANDSQLALLFVDLDRFKQVNDGFGHPFGDVALRAVAERLASHVKEGDTIARLGGDEFVIIIESLEQIEDVVNVAQRINRTFEQPFHIQGHELYLTTSVGISLYPQDGSDADTLLRNADAAMYRAKNKGRSKYQFYSVEITTRAFERVLMETQLRSALERDQFELHYQPQMSLSDHALVGVEALLRWQHPEMGLVSPARFIPLAEETGLIVPIGEWILRTACEQRRSWSEAGHCADDMTVSVNLSGRQLDDEKLVERVASVLQETGLAAELLELEITETHVMERPEKSLQLLQKLRELGVQLAIDDFGTGYSSLSYLKQMPITKLKIDRAFVCDLPQDQGDAAIANAVVALGKNLQLKVIAEGIEHQAQETFLREAHCDFGQGHYYGAAMPNQRLATLLASDQPLHIPLDQD